jgi:hypothetical protein
MTELAHKRQHRCRYCGTSYECQLTQAQCDGDGTRDPPCSPCLEERRRHFIELMEVLEDRSRQ